MLCLDFWKFPRILDLGFGRKINSESLLHQSGKRQCQQRAPGREGGMLKEVTFRVFQFLAGDTLAGADGHCKGLPWFRKGQDSNFPPTSPWTPSILTTLSYKFAKYDFRQISLVFCGNNILLYHRLSKNELSLPMHNALAMTSYWPLYSRNNPFMAEKRLCSKGLIYQKKIFRCHEGKSRSTTPSNFRHYPIKTAVELFLNSVKQWEEDLSNTSLNVIILSILLINF